MRLVQVELQREAVLGGGVHGRLVDHIAVAARLLGLVERDVGFADQLVGARPQTDRETDRGGDRECPRARSVQLDRLPQDGQDPLGHQLGTRVEAARIEQDQELVAAEPGHRVRGAHHAFETRGDRLQGPVAGGVPETVVDVLEAVDVEIQHRDR